MSDFSDHGTKNNGLAGLDEGNPFDYNKEKFCKVNLEKIVKILNSYPTILTFLVL